MHSCNVYDRSKYDQVGLTGARAWAGDGLDAAERRAGAPPDARFPVPVWSQLAVRGALQPIRNPVCIPNVLALPDILLVCVLRHAHCLFQLRCLFAHSARQQSVDDF